MSGGIAARALVGCVALTLVTAQAEAHDTVERGLELMRGAEFQRALDEFERAEAADDLTLADLIRLLEGRALVHSALGDHEEMAADMRRLASIAPDHELAVEAPPEMVEAFEEAADEGSERLSVVINAEAAGDGARLEAVIEGDPTSAVREIRLRARVAGGPWQEGDEGQLTLEGDEGAEIEYFAEAVGPGGAVLARAGTQEQPRTARISDDIGRDDRRSRRRGRRRLPRWAWATIGGTAGAVILGVVVGVVVTSVGENDEGAVVLPPTVEF